MAACKTLNESPTPAVRVRCCHPPQNIPRNRHRSDFRRLSWHQKAHVQAASSQNAPQNVWDTSTPPVVNTPNTPECPFKGMQRARQSTSTRLIWAVIGIGASNDRNNKSNAIPPQEAQEATTTSCSSVPGSGFQKKPVVASDSQESSATGEYQRRQHNAALSASAQGVIHDTDI